MNFNQEGECALIIASAKGCIESVRMLIEYKADLNIQDNQGNTALHWAVRRHFTIIALMLIQAECNMDIADYVNNFWN
jgi:ankyrin repeat protein